MVNKSAERIGCCTVRLSQAADVFGDSPIAVPALTAPYRYLRSPIALVLDAPYITISPLQNFSMRFTYIFHQQFVSFLYVMQASIGKFETSNYI